MREQGGDGGALEDAGPTTRLAHGAAVVVGPEVLLADEELFEDVQIRVHVHVEGGQPSQQPPRVPEGEAMEDEAGPFDAIAAPHATCEDHASCCGCERVNCGVETPTHARERPLQVTDVISSPARAPPLLLLRHVLCSEAFTALR